MPRLKTIWKTSRLRRHFIRWRIQLAESDLHLAHAVALREIELRTAELDSLRTALRQVEQPVSTAEVVHLHGLYSLSCGT